MSSQQTLFDVEPLPWELDDQVQQLVATIVFPDGPPGEFDYGVPDAMLADGDGRARLEAGRRARVPLGRGNRAVIGYCVALAVKTVAQGRLKQVAAVLDPAPLLSPVMLRLTRWMADYYLCPWGRVLEAVVPSGVRAQAGTRRVTLLTVPTAVAAQLTQLKLPTKQAEVLRLLAGSRQPLTARQLADRAGCTTAPIHSLRKKGLIAEQDGRIANHRSVETAPRPREAAHSLNQDQQAALAKITEALDAREHHTVLVHGVTGSGKTEVYIRAIERVVSFGRQAIVLVPEISLTPQTVARFEARFDSVAVWHSHQSGVERHRHWQRIAAGGVQVVVGARSAVFAPTPNLGLIVLDEEHESSFKQETAPRYHARDVALWRTREEEVPLVLGSATPSLESWHRAAQQEFDLVEMPRRVLDRPMPAVGTIDLRLDENRRGSRGAISRSLRQAMGEALGDGGQVILLLNRRGFSTHIQCPACGEVVKCPHCDMSLTFHRHHNSALCHYCDYEIAAPGKCPDCNFSGIRFSGLGTQKLEAEVRARFPQYECVRMDTDSMRRPGSHDAALRTFREGGAQILLGTQMIAKGLDFPNVTLVGVVQADIALNLPDFRAAERTFQLVTQVAGRTGRGAKGGRVIVQTFSPDHPAIVAAVRHDYQAFARYELPGRELAGYPPFARMVRIVVRGDSEQAAEQFAQHIGERLAEAIERQAVAVQLRGPAPAPIAKLRGQFRFHLQLQAPNAALLREVVVDVTRKLKPPEKVAWIVDVDPVEML